MNPSTRKWHSELCQSVGFIFQPRWTTSLCVCRKLSRCSLFLFSLDTFTICSMWNFRIDDEMKMMLLVRSSKEEVITQSTDHNQNSERWKVSIGALRLWMTERRTVTCWKSKQLNEKRRGWSVLRKKAFHWHTSRLMHSWKQWNEISRSRKSHVGQINGTKLISINLVTPIERREQGNHTVTLRGMGRRGRRDTREYSSLEGNWYCQQVLSCERLRKWYWNLEYPHLHSMWSASQLCWHLFLCFSTF